MPPYNADQRRAALREFLSEYKLSARKLCETSGLSPSALTQFLNGHSRSLTDETYTMLAYGASELLGWQVTTGLLRGEIPLQVPVMGYGIVMPEAAEDDLGLGRSSEFGYKYYAPYIEWDVQIARAPRLPALRARESVFAVPMYDRTMSPWREPDSLIFAERLRQPRPNDYVIVEFKPISVKGTPFVPIIAARFVERDPFDLTVRIFQPEKTLQYDNLRVQHLHRVIDWQELVFGPDFEGYGYRPFL
jgi:transcriptional regulator with XRE-family HTH domain